MPLKAWQQSTPYSCGASCLMCALSEINDFPLSSENEIRLWESLHPPYYPGILPASLAVYAHKNQVPSQIFYSEERVSSFIGKLSSAYEPVKKLLFSENKNSIVKAEKDGIPVHFPENKNFLENILTQHLTQDSQKLILTIELSFAHLHYVLIRKNNENSFSVMDPAAGKNYLFIQEALIKEFQPHSVGIAVLLG